jgi:hypothetical protein
MKKITIIITASYLLFACNDASKKDIEEAKKMTIDSMTTEAKMKDAKQSIIDSMTTQAKIEKAKQFTVDSLKSVAQINKSTTSNYKAKPNELVGYKANSTTTETAQPAPTVYTKKKKKMSNVAKGALIGAGVGAISGAVIAGKNKPGRGAIIGGVVGAGLGSVTGVIIDKKQKKSIN